MTPDEILELEAGRNVYALTQPATLTTWAPVDLADILAGDYEPPTPTLLRRSDGRALLYPGRSHAIHAEPEAMKTWLALRGCAEEIVVCNTVAYIDFEDSAPSIVGRLRALGVNAQQVQAFFIYLRPDEPLSSEAVADLDAVLALKPVLVVIDGVTEAFSRQGLNPSDNSDVATWLELLPRRIVRAGAACLQLDHVVKDPEHRGRFAIGGQHKLAGVDVAYSLKVIQPFGRGRDGSVSVTVQKDRPGGVREFAEDNIVATLHGASHDNGQVSITLTPPDQAAISEFRPTYLMEKASEAIEAQPGIGARDLRVALTGKNNDAKDQAIRLLIAERFVDKRPEGRATAHYSLKPYRQEHDGAYVPDGASIVPGTVLVDGAYVPAPLKGARRIPGTVPATNDRINGAVPGDSWTEAQMQAPVDQGRDE